MPLRLEVLQILVVSIKSSTCPPRRADCNERSQERRKFDLTGGFNMVRKTFLVAALALVAGLASYNDVQAQQAQPQAQAYGRAWGGAASNRDYERFNHYPYVYYPQNFYGNEYFRSSDSLYHRYPAEMQIPVYNRKWENYYPTAQRYHWGHHFLTDVF